MKRATRLRILMTRGWALPVWFLGVLLALVAVAGVSAAFMYHFTPEMELWGRVLINGLLGGLTANILGNLGVRLRRDGWQILRQRQHQDELDKRRAEWVG